jgi:hypothetical protein
MAERSAQNGSLLSGNISDSQRLEPAGSREPVRLGLPKCRQSGRSAFLGRGWRQITQPIWAVQVVWLEVTLGTPPSLVLIVAPQLGPPQSAGIRVGGRSIALILPGLTIGVFSGVFPGTFDHVTAVTVSGASLVPLFSTVIIIVGKGAGGLIGPNLQRLGDVTSTDEGTKFAPVGGGAQPAHTNRSKPTKDEIRVSILDLHSMATPAIFQDQRGCGRPGTQLTRCAATLKSGAQAGKMRPSSSTMVPAGRLTVFADDTRNDMAPRPCRRSRRPMLMLS